MEISRIAYSPGDCKRPDWHNYFIGIAEAVSRRSTCPRLSVGAVIVCDNKVVATGYNGAPAGLVHCTIAGCKMLNDHCTTAVHAESNALRQIKKQFLKREGVAIYITHRPCMDCMAEIYESSIERAYYLNEYRV